MEMITLQELSEALSQYLKVSEFKDFGPNGIQIEGRNEIKKIAFSESASLNVIEKAINENADALIVHHGLFWEKQPLVLEGVQKNRVKKILENDLSLLAYHLPLDAHKEVGNNFLTLEAIGARNLSPFDGIGAKGEIHLSKQDFLNKIKQVFGVTAITPPVSIDFIKKVAVVTGGAHSSLKSKDMHDVDAFITGTCDEWVYEYAQESNKLFVPIGHYRSELIGIKALMMWVKRQLLIETCFIQTENPY
jgi:dinuclear metal center YbgI/SA1388 family protein